MRCIRRLHYLRPKQLLSNDVNDSSEQNLPLLSCSLCMLQASSLTVGCSCCDQKHVQYTVTSLLHSHPTVFLVLLASLFFPFFNIFCILQLVFRALCSLKVSKNCVSLPLLIYLTLCTSDCGATSSLGMNLGVYHLSCLFLIYTHLSIYAVLCFSVQDSDLLIICTFNKASFVSEGDLV